MSASGSSRSQVASMIERLLEGSSYEALNVGKWVVSDGERIEPCRLRSSQRQIAPGAAKSKSSLRSIPGLVTHVTAAA